MSQFAYQALDEAGRRVSGIEESPNRTAALDRLTARRLFVTRIEEAGATGSRRWRDGLTILPPASAGELVLFYRRLATLLAAGIPLLEGLDAIAGQTSNARLAAVLGQVRDDVRGGRSFSEALTRHPRVFPELVTSMARVGETGGILGPVLDQTADFTQRDHELRTEVLTALAYPIIVLLVATATVVLLLTTVIPRLSTLFQGMEAALPLPTRMLLGASDLFSSWGWLLLILLVAAGVGLHRLRRTPRGAEFIDRTRLRLPLLGTLATKATIARFARSLGALLHGGVPLMEGLDVVDRVLGNRVLTDAVERVKDRVRRGESLGRSLRDEPLFPDMVKYMVSAGEDSGKLDEMLGKVADIYELETRQLMKVTISLLAPLLILVLAAVVGFIALAMLLPIAQINQTLG
ncbi:MAG: type II secretion system F family protein [Candidatus Sumerlaeia bacterium]|nr:type II secretion system F family protein [Candidatus Sumerlaeia bacterium]